MTSQVNTKKNTSQVRDKNINNISEMRDRDMNNNTSQA